METQTKDPVAAAHTKVRSGLDDFHDAVDVIITAYHFQLDDVGIFLYTLDGVLGGFRISEQS